MTADKSKKLRSIGEKDEAPYSYRIRRVLLCFTAGMNLAILPFMSHELFLPVYLPIAELSVSLPLLVGIGLGIGILSGIFGVGGGFLSTPLLIFMGIPVPIVVGSQASQLTAVAVSGVLAHWRRDRIDVKMGLYMLAGGIIGSLVGSQLFGYLKHVGQMDLIVSLGFIVMLGLVSLIMLGEGILASFFKKRREEIRQEIKISRFNFELPMKIYFEKSNLKVSALIPMCVGFLISILVSILGIGGGFLMIPAMIYLLKMPPSIVGGTSLFQVMFTTAIVAFLQAYRFQTVDMVLSILMIIGGVVGAQIGVKISQRFHGSGSRALLAIIALLVCAKLCYGLIVTPLSMFEVD